MTPYTYDVIVIGGGAAGLMAAGTAAEYGRRVLLLEKNDRLAHKVRITGKGRCNVTNFCELDAFLEQVPRNPRFLYSALSAFLPKDTMAFLEQLGVPLKVERGNRVFPVSDKAQDIVDALIRYAKNNGAEVVFDEAKSLWIEQGVLQGVKGESGTEYASPSVIIATGGKSYPRTGSTGDGYRFARQAGHTVTPLVPSLVPLLIQEPWCKELQGLSLKNVLLTATKESATVYSEQGEMLFTHFGVSGPLVLSASAHLRDMKSGKYRLLIDLKPALDFERLDARLLRDFEEAKNRDFANALGKLLPRKLIPVVIQLSGIPMEQKVHQITREQRHSLCRLLKALPLTVGGFRPIEEAIVTSGGVEPAEIRPKTMESKLLSGLFFAGEVIDVDAYTGGFNLQIAFATGKAAGLAASLAY